MLNSCAYSVRRRREYKKPNPWSWNTRPADNTLSYQHTVLVGASTCQYVSKHRIFTGHDATTCLFLIVLILTWLKYVSFKVPPNAFWAPYLHGLPAEEVPDHGCLYGPSPLWVNELRHDMHPESGSLRLEGHSGSHNHEGQENTLEAKNKAVQTNTKHYVASELISKCILFCFVWDRQVRSSWNVWSFLTHCI